MSTGVIQLIDVLVPEEITLIDDFCVINRESGSLPALSGFLSESFDLELVLDPDIVGGFALDSSNLFGHADALCRPRSERECAIIFRACHKSGIPYTVSAGRSNLTGSATPSEGVVVSTVNMMTPEVCVDAAAGIASAPVGMILEDFRNTVLEKGAGELHFPVDPTSRAEATVGGALACNASGFTPGDMGSIRHWVEAVDFLLPDGLKIAAHRGQYISESGRFILEHNRKSMELPVLCHPRPAIKNAGGPYSSADGIIDFIDFAVGSEGLFGMVTGCMLRLAPKPDDALDLFFSLPDEENAIAFYKFVSERLSGNLGSLSALEYFGANCRSYMEHEDRLFCGDDQVAVYVQIPLKDKSMEEVADEWLGLLIQSGCGVDEDAILLIDNERDRKMFLEARHSLPANALEVVQHRGTYTIMTDTVVPPERFPEFLNYTHGILRAEGLDYLAFGHLGDCHLHFTVLPEKAQLDRAAEVYSMIVAKSAELGGVYSGEHGTGKRKRDDFIRCYGQEVVERVRACKAVVDPDLLLNRGNVFQ